MKSVWKRAGVAFAIAFLFALCAAAQQSAETAKKLDSGYDIIVRGVFVFTTSPPPLESDIKLKVFVPPGRTAVPPLGMHLRGRVVRVEAARSGNPGADFAIAGERFVLRRGE
jgi:hypothetical protein